MKQRVWVIIATFLFLATVPGLCSARLIDNWPYARLYKEADMVVIGVARSNRDATESFIDERWPLKFVGQNTTFGVLQVLKGNRDTKKVVVLHFKFGKFHEKATKIEKKYRDIVDAPSFVSFATKPIKVTIAEEELANHKCEYLLFLKKRSDGRFEPVSGRIDPNLSIREMFPPFIAEHKAQDQLMKALRQKQ
jgi:hypothetical protein